MMLSSELFYVAGQPCDDERIAEIEARLEAQLPQALRDFIKTYGGGAVRQEYGFLRSASYTDASNFEFVDTIYGNGASGAQDFSIDDYAMHLSLTWDVPSWAVLIGLAEGGPHSLLLLNVDNPAYPAGAVVYSYEDLGQEVMLYERCEDFFAELLEQFIPDEAADLF